MKTMLTIHTAAATLTFPSQVTTSSLICLFISLFMISANKCIIPDLWSPGNLWNWQPGQDKCLTVVLSYHWNQEKASTARCKKETEANKKFPVTTKISHTDRVCHVATSAQVFTHSNSASEFVHLEEVHSKAFAFQPVAQVSLFKNRCHVSAANKFWKLPSESELNLRILKLSGQVTDLTCTKAVRNKRLCVHQCQCGVFLEGEGGGWVQTFHSIQAIYQTKNLSSS